MKSLKSFIAIATGLALLFLSVGVVQATHNEYVVAPTSFSEAAGAVRITVSIGCTNPRDTKFQTVDGTAQGGRDYTAVSGQFAVSSAAPRTFDLPVLNDNIPETDESIELILDGPQGSTSGGSGTDSQGACLGTPSKRVMLFIHDDDPRSGAGEDVPTQSDATPGALGPTVVATPEDAGGLQTTEVGQSAEYFFGFPAWALGVAGLLAGAAIVGLIWFWRQRQQPGESG